MERKHRSPSYPQMGIREAVEKTERLYQAIGTHPTSREVVAKGLGYSGISGSSATAISTLNKYGLLDGRGDEVRVSDRAMAILHPHSKGEREQALRAAALEPELFRELADKFPGKTPNDDLLRNYLLRNKFAPNAVDAAILAYKETIEFVGGFESGYDSGPNSKKEPASMQPDRIPLSGGDTVDADAKERQIGRWDFEGGGYMRIVVTPDVDTSEALDYVETLVTLKRKELERRRRQEIPEEEN